MPATETCGECGVPVALIPEDEGMHPAQRAVENGDSTVCRACDGDGGEHRVTGEAIRRASQVDAPDDELAGELAEALSAAKLRRWMSFHDLKRSRGARKLESAEQAVEQDRDLVAATVDELVGLGTTDPHSAMCSCGYEEHFEEEDAAEEAARAHKQDNPQHFPKAWADGGNRRLYG